jgi:predicted nucleotidyltransferase component of viral defense system
MALSSQRKVVMNDVIRRMLQRYSPKNHAEAERSVREILQEVTLIGLWRGKFFEHAAFYGGTALRILYGLDRFSEDLDFTLLNPNQPFNWHVFEKSVVDELLGYGFEVTFAEKKKQIETAVQSAFLKTNTRHALLQIGVKELFHQALHPDALIRIKVEIDSRPTLGFETELIYLKEPLPVSIRAVKESSLFAGKTHAALYRAWKQRVKGRDWYDLVWFLRRGIPLNRYYLQECLHAADQLPKHEILTEEKIKELLFNRVEKIDLKAAADDVRPFLRDSSQLDLWSVDFFRHWISLLKFDSNSPSV